MSIRSCLRLFALQLLPAVVVFWTGAIPARAEGPPRPPDDPLFWRVPLSLDCHFLGGCAHFDQLSLKISTATLFRGSASRDARFAAVSGLVRASISFLDLAELGASFGGYVTHDEAGALSSASMPAILDAKLRLWPMPWRKVLDSGGLQVGVSFQRSFVSDKFGALEPPGFDTNTVALVASRAFGPVDVDLSAGAIWGSRAPDLRRAVQVSGSAALRLFGLARPIGPDEQLRVIVQAAYRWSLPGDGFPSDGYVLFGFEHRTHSGYRFGLAAGPYVLGARAGGMGMLTFSVAWGQRYRNPLAEWLASQPPWIPRGFMDFWHVDPVLEDDGCVWTDPAFLRWRIKCIGHPDPKDPRLILLDDGRRLPVGTHLWIREDDGMLITQRQQELGAVEADTAKRAIMWQRMLQAMRGGEEKACPRVHSVLEEAQQSNVFALATVMEAAPGLALADWINRVRACGLEDAASGGPLFPPVGRLSGGGMRQIPPNRAAVGSPITDKARSHIFYGDVSKNKNKSVGWHYEPSADPKKGTYVIEGTRTAPDEHGVYAANVMIEGIKKNARSTFFPKHWSQEQVEQAILEAYENRKPYPTNPGYFSGIGGGVEIEMQLKADGRIHTAYPLLQIQKGSYESRGP